MCIPVQFCNLPLRILFKGILFLNLHVTPTDPTHQNQFLDVIGIYSVYICHSLSLVRFSHPIICDADKHIVNIMKLYIERDNLEL